MSSNSITTQYQAVVFRRAGDTADFTASTEVSLAGQHSEGAAWHAVFEELRGPRGGDLVGGEVRAFAENVRKPDAENACHALQAS